MESIKNVRNACQESGEENKSTSQPVSFIPADPCLSFGNIGIAANKSPNGVVPTAKSWYHTRSERSNYFTFKKPVLIVSFAFIQHFSYQSLGEIVVKEHTC